MISFILHHKKYSGIHLVENEGDVHDDDDEDPTDLEKIKLLAEDDPVTQERVD